MKLIVLVPGGSFTQGFMESWTNLILAAKERDFQLSLNIFYCPVVTEGRNQLLVGSLKPPFGRDTKPFGGMDYDYILWIDSDMVFTPEDVTKLMQADKDIISGVYSMGSKGHEREAVAGFLKGGRVRLDQLTSMDSVTEIDYAGLGFLMVKKGVFESMEYPWFNKVYVNSKDGKIMYAGNDFSFCLRAKTLGWKVYLHTDVILGHQKNYVLEVDGCE